MSILSPKRDSNPGFRLKKAAFLTIGPERQLFFKAGAKNFNIYKVFLSQALFSLPPGPFPHPLVVVG